MYLWTAIDVSEPLADIREKALEANREIGLEESAFTLPQHISLKISFSIDDGLFPQAVAEIAGYLKGQKPFPVKVGGIEKNGNILWIRMEPSPWLEALHEGLNIIAREKFGIANHPFDDCFLFHSTLFSGGEPEKLEKMFEKLRDAKIPETLWGSRFVMGCSRTGQAGDYQVIRQISVEE